MGLINKQTPQKRKPSICNACKVYQSKAVATPAQNGEYENTALQLLPPMETELYAHPTESFDL